jgi:hypothetical protein
VLKPVVARYQGGVVGIRFRADAAFAMPSVYGFLEAKGIETYFAEIDHRITPSASEVNALIKPARACSR